MSDIQSNPQPPQGGTFYINYYDAIDLPRVKVIMDVCANIISRHKPDEIYFLFSSPGGDVNSGIVLYNYLRSLPTKITMHSTGVIDSIGNVVFSAGSRRLAAPHSTFLFHGVSMNIGKDQRFSLNQIDEIRSMVNADQEKIAGVLKENTKLSEEDILKLFQKGESKDATFAKEKGIIDEIIKPTIPLNAPFITVNVN